MWGHRASRRGGGVAKAKHLKFMLDTRHKPEQNQITKFSQKPKENFVTKQFWTTQKWFWVLCCVEQRNFLKITQNYPILKFGIQNGLIHPFSTVCCVVLFLSLGYAHVCNVLKKENSGVFKCCRQAGLLDHATSEERKLMMQGWDGGTKSLSY